MDAAPHGRVSFLRARGIKVDSSRVHASWVICALPLFNRRVVRLAEASRKLVWPTGAWSSRDAADYSADCARIVLDPRRRRPTPSPKSEPPRPWAAAI